MKIAHVTCVYPFYRGGIGSVAYHQAFEEAKHGHQVTVFTPHYKDRKYKESEHIKLHLLKPFFAFGNAAFLPQIFWKLREFDVVHLHYPFLGVAEIVALWKIFSRSKKHLVVRYHMDLLGKSWKKIFFRIYNFLFLKWILRIADAVLVNSFDYFEHSQAKKALRFCKEKVFEIAFGVDIKRFSPQTKNGELMRKFSILETNKVILFVGGLDTAHYFKGLEYLIRSVGILPNKQDIKILIVGQPGDLVGYYKGVAKQVGVLEQCIFAGQIDDSIFSDVYNLCDVFVLPSVDQSEAFGVATLEAGACGRPAIVSDLPGVRTLVQDGYNGFCVDPKDVTTLAEKINMLLTDNELGKRLGENFRRKVLQNYTHEIIYEKTFSVYENIVGKSK